MRAGDFARKFTGAIGDRSWIFLPRVRFIFVTGEDSTIYATCAEQPRAQRVARITLTMLQFLQAPKSAIA
jgi:hypothetical protein